MLLKITDSAPWYAEIVNFIVAGYVPPGVSKRKLIHDSRSHLWDDPYLYKVGGVAILGTHFRTILARAYSPT
jgi:hypothetical protein